MKGFFYKFEHNTLITSLRTRRKYAYIGEMVQDNMKMFI